MSIIPGCSIKLSPPPQQLSHQWHILPPQSTSINQSVEYPRLTLKCKALKHYNILKLDTSQSVPLKSRESGWNKCFTARKICGHVSVETV